MLSGQRPEGTELRENRAVMGLRLVSERISHSATHGTD